MTPLLRRIVSSLAVLFWSAVLLYFYASGRINVYLAPDFRIIAFVGGLGLAVLGGFNLLTVGKVSACGHDHHSGEDVEMHDHETGEVHPLLALLLIVVPVACSVAWTKDAYSLAALTRKGAYESPAEAGSPVFAASMPPLTREIIEQGHRQSEDGFYEFNLMELFFATGDRELQSIIQGMKVETEGRWIEEKNSNAAGTRKRLYRLFMTCCVADSRAIPIILEFGDAPPEFPENGWVRVAGTMEFPLENGLLQPVLKVERAMAAEPPYEESFIRK